MSEMVLWCVLSRFKGTGIAVVGALEPSSTSGRPTTKYSIDRQDVGSYTAPSTSQTKYNVTFFSKRDLPRGNHDVMITFMDATSPNRFWLDYFLVYDEASPPKQDSSPPPDSATTTTGPSGGDTPTTRTTRTHTSTSPPETTKYVMPRLPSYSSQTTCIVDRRPPALRKAQLAREASMGATLYRTRTFLSGISDLLMLSDRPPAATPLALSSDQQHWGMPRAPNSQQAPNRFCSQQ